MVAIDLPLLQERAGDVPLLVDHFVSTRQIGKVPLMVSPEAADVLVRYDWPGNVRELANVIERAQILAEGNTITPDDLSENLVGAAPRPPSRVAESPDALDAVERRHAADVPARPGGNKVRATKALGVSRRTLYRLIEKYALADGPAPCPAHEP